MCLYMCVCVCLHAFIHADVSIHVLVCVLKLMHNLYVCVHTYTFMIFSRVIVYRVHTGTVIDFIILSMAGMILNQYLDGTRQGIDLTLRTLNMDELPLTRN